MQIINPQVDEDLRSGKKLRLNLGAGGPDSEGRYTVDQLRLPGIDIVADLNSPLDLLPDNSVSEIFTSHALEHVDKFMPLMHEIHRIVRPGGKIEIIVPHFSSALAYSDPTHVRFFGFYSMYYFVDDADQPPTRKVPAFYTSIRFRVESAQLNFYDWGTFVQRWLGPFMTRFWNKSLRRLHFYETHLAYLYPADEIRYVLSPAK
jgi:ubiquinone/menaquinone biosynthesis C-methylase UbiE